jgi:hypothetical protein
VTLKVAASDQIAPSALLDTVKRTLAEALMKKQLSEATARRSFDMGAVTIVVLGATVWSNTRRP